MLDIKIEKYCHPMLGTKGGFNLTNKEYHNSGRFGSSSLGSILKNAKKWRLEKDGIIDSNTKAFDTGTVLHTTVLEPEMSAEVFRIGNPINDELKFISDKGLEALQIWTKTKTKNSKAFTEAQAISDKTLVLPHEYEAIEDYLENPSLIAISEDEFSNVQRMAENILHLKNFQQYLGNGVVEVSFQGVIDGLPVQCRLDLLFTKGDRVLVIDVKSTAKEASADGFSKSSSDFLYFLQEALYREVLLQNGYTDVTFLFAVASKLEWSGAGYFRHSAKSLEIGRALLKKAIQKTKYCLENNIWLEDNFDFKKNKFNQVNDVQIGPWVLNKYG